MKERKSIEKAGGGAERERCEMNERRKEKEKSERKRERKLRERMR